MAECRIGRGPYSGSETRPAHQGRSWFTVTDRRQRAHRHQSLLARWKRTEALYGAQYDREETAELRSLMGVRERAERRTWYVAEPERATGDLHPMPYAMSQREIARALDISSVRVGQIIAKALAKLRRGNVGWFLSTLRSDEPLLLQRLTRYELLQQKELARQKEQREADVELMRSRKRFRCRHFATPPPPAPARSPTEAELRACVLPAGVDREATIASLRSYGAPMRVHWFGEPED